MNTTTHPLSTYWLVHGRPHAGWAALASFVPDAAYLVALGVGFLTHGASLVSALLAKAGGDPDAMRRAGVAAADIVWSTWASPAANFVAQKVLHNLLLASIFAIVALASRRPLLRALALGWMLHVWTDMALHANDAYAIVWPITSRVFPSPVSYWDPEHHSRIVGRVLALMAAALWVWLALRVRRSTLPRRRFRMGLCVAMFLGSAAGLIGGPPRESRQGQAWLYDGVEFPPELHAIADTIANGHPHDSLELIRTTELKNDPNGLPWSRHHARARQQLLQGYAQDLKGNREQALVSYRIAERLEPVGGVGDKARRYRGEPFTNTPDPAVSNAWLALFGIGLVMSAILIWDVRRQAAVGMAGEGGGVSGASSALPPR